VAAFRQQLIEWQGEVTEMRRALAVDETRLERRQVRVAEQQRHNEEATVRLAQQAEQVQQQERAVAERRGEMERHLADMREWYRLKLRELTLGRQSIGTTPPVDPPREDRKVILSLTEDIEPGDRQLGDLLRSLGLVDPETLSVLLVEARKQRRSLRQALLTGGYLTLYQLALIEAGNLGGLVLGPLRVIDRLRVTVHEALYRVFDPRHGREAVLRHLAEEALDDAVRPDEYRQRFTQAASLQHTNVAATYEVFQLAERPAVLQEWLSGLASSDWPPLAAVPGVWYRLLVQATRGLDAAHQAGLAHAQLTPSRFVLTEAGVLKLCGVGEPPWLTQEGGNAEDPIEADLRCFGQVVADWATMAVPLKGARARPMPDALRAVLDRLTTTDPETRFPSTADLLGELERLEPAVPAHAEAWDRLLRHVAEHALPGVALRQSA
jgi:hypothetical protein